LPLTINLIQVLAEQRALAASMTHTIPAPRQRQQNLLLMNLVPWHFGHMRLNTSGGIGLSAGRTMSAPNKYDDVMVPKDTSLSSTTTTGALCARWTALATACVVES
jgi:hypothetical protein